MKNKAIIPLSEYEHLKFIKEKFIHLEKGGTLIRSYYSTAENTCYNKFTFCKDEENELKKALVVHLKEIDKLRDELSEAYSENFNLRKRNLIQRILNK